MVDRSTRHLRLTGTDGLLRPYALHILADVAEAGTALDSFAGVPRGILRVNVPFTIAVAVALRMVTAFPACNPDVRTVLDVEHRIIDMPVQPTDLVVRVGALPDSGLIARHLTTTEMWTCASPGYLAAQGTPASVTELGRHELITVVDRTMTWSYRVADGAMEQIEVRPGNVVSEPAALKPILVGGAGIGQLPDFIAEGVVARGDFLRLFPAVGGDAIDSPALYTSHRSLSAKVRIFIDALVAHLATETWVRAVST